MLTDWEKISLEDLVPHSGKMLLLDRILEVGEKYLEAELRVRADGLFDQEGCVPALVGLEYMAQGVAAYAGAQALLSSNPVRLGFLLGTRYYHGNVSEIGVGTKLTLRVHEVLRDEHGLGVFECKLEGDGVRISARINVYQPEDIHIYLTGQIKS